MTFNKPTPWDRTTERNQMSAFYWADGTHQGSCKKKNYDTRRKISANWTNRGNRGTETRRCHRGDDRIRYASVPAASSARPPPPPWNTPGGPGDSISQPAAAPLLASAQPCNQKHLCENHEIVFCSFFFYFLYSLSRLSFDCWWNGSGGGVCVCVCGVGGEASWSVARSDMSSVIKPSAGQHQRGVATGSLCRRVGYPERRDF